MADRLEPIHDGLAHALSVQRTLHGDETGWKMDGQRWQMWCFCNTSLAFFHADKSRGSKVVLGLLGKDFDGLLHCDFYAAYNNFPNLQRCLIHFARDVHDERLVTPKDVFLAALHDNTQLIMDSAKALRSNTLPAAAAKALQRGMHQALKTMTALDPPESRALTLVRRLRKHRDSLLKFLSVPGAEFHNNRAERQLRPVVIFRKPPLAIAPKPAPTASQPWFPSSKPPASKNSISPSSSSASASHNLTNSPNSPLNSSTHPEPRATLSLKGA
jgi:transposase